MRVCAPNRLSQKQIEHCQSELDERVTFSKSESGPFLRLPGQDPYPSSGRLNEFESPELARSERLFVI